MRASLANVRGPKAALAAVGLALFCIQLDFFGLNLAIPNMAHDLQPAPMMCSSPGPRS